MASFWSSSGRMYLLRSRLSSFVSLSFITMSATGQVWVHGAQSVTWESLSHDVISFHRRTEPTAHDTPFLRNREIAQSVHVLKHVKQQVFSVPFPLWNKYSYQQLQVKHLETEILPVCLALMLHSLYISANCG